MDMPTVIKNIEVILQFVLHAVTIIIYPLLESFSNHKVATNQY